MMEIPSSGLTKDEIRLNLKVAAASCAVTLLLFFVSEFILKLWTPSFISGLTRQKKLSLLTHIPSGIHAVAASALSTYALLYSEELASDYIWGRCQIASIACAVTVGYMFGDFLIMVMKWKEVGEWSFVFHHLCSVVAFLYVILVGKYRFFAMVRLFAEYSTLFVNARAALHMLGMQNGSAYFYNGLVMVFSFSCARILPLPIYLYCVSTIMDRDDYRNDMIGKVMIWSSTLILDTLNVLWFIKMLKGAVKVWNSHKNNTSSHTSATRVKSVKQG